MGNQIFATRLREEREKRGWTQEFMANLLGVKSATLSGYERCYREPDLSMLVQISQLFGLPVDYLLGNDKWNNIQKPWYQQDLPQLEVDLEKFIKNQANLKLFGKRLDEASKRDILLALRTAGQFIKKDPS